jgi:hypothetical protein
LTTQKKELSLADAEYLTAIQSSIITANHGINLAANAAFYLRKYDSKKHSDSVRNFEQEIQQLGKKAYEQTNDTYKTFESVRVQYNTVCIQEVLYISSTD